MGPPGGQVTLVSCQAKPTSFTVNACCGVEPQVGRSEQFSLSSQSCQHPHTPAGLHRVDPFPAVGSRFGHETNNYEFGV